ncbi:N-(5'-phosphoribosyl)anthranilate isomerase [bacterium]|nr:N-(5'-phosphoribosyl)anthranilate isomerase [bacterium]
MDVIRQTNPDFWLAQVFSAKAVTSAGVIRRSKRWVEAEIGLDRFENCVKARGFHLIEAGQQLVVICHSGPIALRF